MKFLSNIFLGGLLLTASTVAFASPRVGEKKVSRVSDNRTGVTFETSAFVTKDAAIRLAVKKMRQSAYILRYGMLKTSFCTVKQSPKTKCRTPLKLT